MLLKINFTCCQRVVLPFCNRPGHYALLCCAVSVSPQEPSCLGRSVEGRPRQGHPGLYFSGSNDPTPRSICPRHTFLYRNPQPPPALTEAVGGGGPPRASPGHAPPPVCLAGEDDSNHRGHLLAFSACPPAAAAVVTFCTPLPSSPALEPASWQPWGNN